MTRILIISTIYTMLGISFRAAAIGDCWDIGFNSGTLKCDTCANLKSIVADDELYQECMKCCLSSIEERYELAVLELDRRFVSRFPELSDIVKSEMNIVVRYRLGALPTLLMYRERTDEAPTESVSVVSWSKDVLREYLDAHL